jgi:hypothetical protein
MSDNGGDKSAEIDEEEQTEEVNAVSMEAIRQALRGTTLKIGERGDVNGIFANALSFAKLSRGNDTVQKVTLYLYGDYYRDYKMLRVLGESFGNLESLQVLTVRSQNSQPRDEGDDDDVEDGVMESLYWQAFAGALGQVRNQIELRLAGKYWDSNGGFTGFTAAIQGVSTIQTFWTGSEIDLESASILLSALASLPSLENVTLWFTDEEAPHVAFPELKILLKSSSLRFIEFFKMYCGSGLSQALVEAYEEGSFVTQLRFANCYTACEDDHGDIHDQSTATHKALVQILQTTSSVKTISLVCNDFDELFCSLIASILLVNTTLEDLTLHTDVTEQGGRWLQNLFVAMRINTSLKNLNINGFNVTDEVVCGALRDMLATNSALESLTLHSPKNPDERGSKTN